MSVTQTAFHLSLRRLVPVGLSLALASCVSTRSEPVPVVIVTDLAAVSACAFIGPLGAPPFTPGYRLDAGYQDFQNALRRRTAALGGTHLFLSNPSAGWGGASAIGSIYRCRYTVSG